ncbi:MAG: type II secretion system protein [Pirellulales bacterium]|nr:type II secretion system protein [Pirellulales bacterium]
MKWRVESGEWRVAGSQWPVDGGRRVRHSSFIIRHSSFRVHSPLSTLHSPLLRRGFTLVELLVTITIIGIVAGISLGALQMARRFAAEKKTQATIAKLDAIVMQRYESYRTRRMPITIPPNTRPAIAARLKLNALRDLMRLEMPDRWEDVVRDPLAAVNNNPLSAITTPPALQMAYRNKRNTAEAYLVNSRGMNISDAVALIGNLGGAECLYQFIAMENPSNLEQFSQNEIGDTDNDTLPEFIDGWGKPISLLRWAPGYNSSNVQPNINTQWIPTNINDPNDPIRVQRLKATMEDHDPFDSRKVDVATMDQGNPIPPPNTPPPPNTLPTGWRLVPLIYSGGPDGQYGLCDVQQYGYRGNPYETIKDQNGNFRGMGAPTGESLDFDNITNHQIEMK